MGHEGDSDTDCYWRTLTVPHRLGKGVAGVWNRKTNPDHPNYSIVRIDQYTEKSLGDLLSLSLQWNTISSFWRKNLAWSKIIIIIIIYDMVTQNWIIDCLKMYKLSHEVINFTEKTMQTWRAELTAGGRSLAERKIQRGIFQGDALSPLLFIIAMMPLNHIHRKCTAVYKLSRLQENINHLMYMDAVKLFTKNEKELETLIHVVRI